MTAKSKRQHAGSAAERMTFGEKVIFVLHESAAILVSTWIIPALLFGTIGCLVLMGLDLFVDPARISLRGFMAANAFFILRQGARRQKSRAKE